jgi:uncharacterized membrane protein
VSTGRLEAFSDGVLAIIITVMVLELNVPEGDHLSDLWRVTGVGLLTYVLSFVYIGIYWSNHHHMLQVTDRVTGLILWANLHLLFWLSLIPFTTAWMGENHFAATPAAAYGLVLLAAALAYYALQQAIIRDQRPSSMLARAVGRDRKGKLSPLLYATAVGLSFVDRWLAVAVFVGVALMWLVPDRRVERTITARAADAADR